jgi:hypothetical protein
MLSSLKTTLLGINVGQPCSRTRTSSVASDQLRRRTSSGHPLKSQPLAGSGSAYGRARRSKTNCGEQAKAKQRPKGWSRMTHP